MLCNLYVGIGMTIIKKKKKCSLKGKKKDECVQLLKEDKIRKAKAKARKLNVKKKY